MNTKVAWIAVVVVLALALVWYFVGAQRAAAPTDFSSLSGSSETSATQTTTITLTDAGFEPRSVTIAMGQTVRFVNESSRGMWVGSDEHPTHTEYDGTSTREHCADGTNTQGNFDMCTAVASGGSWEFTFDKPGTFGFHNHVGASHTGTIIVE